MIKLVLVLLIVGCASNKKCLRSEAKVYWVPPATLGGDYKEIEQMTCVEFKK